MSLFDSSQKDIVADSKQLDICPYSSVDMVLSSIKDIGVRGGGAQKVDIKIVNIIIINFALLDKLKSKEPPKTFVPRILVAYICHFKGLQVIFK